MNSKEIRYAIGKEYVEGVFFEHEETDFVEAAYKEISRINQELFDKIPFEVRFTSEDHYDSAKQMREEVLRTGIIYIYEEYSGHPYLNKEQNRIGRAVHDVWAHLVCGCPFSFEGEYNAYLEQRNYYPEWTWAVLFAEIPAQTSAYYYMGTLKQEAHNLYKGVGSFNFKQRALVAPKRWMDLCEPLKKDYSANSILNGLRKSVV